MLVPTGIMACYYKEMFGLGMFATLFIFAGVFLFGDLIVEWFKRIINNLK